MMNKNRGKKQNKNQTSRSAGIKLLAVKLLFALCLSFQLMSVGCSKRFSDLPAFSPFPFRDAYNYSVGRFKTSYLADQIHAYYRGHASGPIAIATFVDIDNLYNSSTFGRLLTEQMMSELSMKGYNVVELRQSEALQVLYDQGEFALSRDVSTLRSKQDVGGIVVGTYTVSPIRIYINTRIIDPSTSLVISAGSVEMPKTDEIERMLRTSVLPPSLERIPVKHLGYNYPGYSQTSYPSHTPWFNAPLAGGQPGGEFAQLPPLEKRKENGKALPQAKQPAIEPEGQPGS